MTDTLKSEMTWSEHQAWERDWWGACTNTFAEEAKQISYAYRMGLELVGDPEGKQRWPLYDLSGRSVLDIGGGPVSLLLKCRNLELNASLVVDPVLYPEWVLARYQAAGIRFVQGKGEHRAAAMAVTDEVWIYNCLQHTEDPETIARNARAGGRTVRVFEWVDIPACPGHPQELKADLLDEWFGGTGTVEAMNGENGCWGNAWYGVFGG